MHVISKARLREFWESRKDDRKEAERVLAAWYKIAEKAHWDNFGDLKQTFGSADRVGNCVVFDVGNNRYRVIGRVNFNRGILYVLRPMDHAEYDRKDKKGRQRWIGECGCDTPPPKPPATKKPPLRGRSAPRKPKGRK